MTDRPVPRASYRLQLTKDFGFAAVEFLAAYLGRLGISHAYLSPVFAARRGSTHGYDVVDHTRLNPELGTDDDFRRMAAALRAHGVGLILDIVPNHMGVGGDQNALWLDVLENGRQSRYAHWFDINWEPSEPTLRNKVLVPFLGSSLSDALANGRLELRCDARDGSLAFWAEGTHKLPLAPTTYADILPDLAGAADPKAWLRDLASSETTAHRVAAAIADANRPERREALARLIERQHWRPARYSVAADDINYRRFFIVSDLAAIRVEDEEVFDYVHRLPFALIAEGLVDGLRVDHIDGLYDPAAYCRRVRERAPRPIYLVVEKILAAHEHLRADWDVDGTTGYEFATAVTQLLTDPSGEADISAAYTRYTGRHELFAEIEHDAKRDIADFEMAAELDALALRLRALAAHAPRTADLTRNALRNGLRHVVAAMPVYRTYVGDGPLADADQRAITVAIAAAREAAPTLEPALFDFLADVMRGELHLHHQSYPAAEVIDLARRIQQYTGPVMAKGLEDTALYRFNRLLALSDVGERPDRFGRSIDAFHDFNAGLARDFPHCMLTSSSHDTKRGEDTRARIATISGRPRAWVAAVDDWTRILDEAGAPRIDPNDAWAFFQLLLGAWPTSLPPTGALDPQALASVRDRLDAAMLKSIREARLRTNWAVPKSAYEDDVSRFVHTALADGANGFLDSFRTLEPAFGEAGARNGLVALTLKLTGPGMPDIYQGTEFWEQSMVDPDNRRPVDFAARIAAVEADAPLSDLLRHWRDGRIKQRFVMRLLALRKETPDLFSAGSYEPLNGADDQRICAFLRRHDTDLLLVAAHLDPWRIPSWSVDLAIPDDIEGRSWTNVLQPGEPQPVQQALRWDGLPVIVLRAT